MVKIGRRKVIEPKTGKSISLKPFEDELQLVAFLEYVDKDRKIGATFLQKNSQSEVFRVVFGFKCQGIAPIMTDVQLENVRQGFNGFNDLLREEHLTLQFGQFRLDEYRQEQLLELMKSQTDDQTRYLIGSMAKRSQDLTDEGIRQTNQLYLWGTFTIGEEGEMAGNGDIFDRFLQGAEKKWLQAIGSYDQVKTQAIQTLLMDAYTKGFNRWETLLTNQVGLSIEAMTLEEIKRESLRRFGAGLNVSAKLNHVVIDLNNNTFEESKKSDLSPKSYFLDNFVPCAGRDHIKLGHQYIGVLIIQEKPDPGDTDAERLFFLHDILASEEIYDVEVFSQLKLGNYRLMIEKMQLLTKQTLNTAKLANEQGDVNVAAELKVQQQLDAQKALYQDEYPFHVGTVILVYRPSLSILKRDCGFLISLFKKLSWIVLEEEYAWKPWLQTFPHLCWQRLLTQPFVRTLTYTTGELPIISPLVCNRTLSNDGLELISHEGGTPIYFDIFKRHNHFGVFAASGSGKSVLLSDIAAHALFYGMPATIMEVPRDDGTGSFDGLCQYLPQLCSYVAIGNNNTGWNLVQPPNLKKFDETSRQDRFQDFLRDLQEILVVMIMGYEKKITDINEDVVRSLLQLALKAFYNDPLILNRFVTAFRGGFGTPSWYQMPTILDFYQFCSLERLAIAENSEQILRAINFTRLRLQAMFASSLGELLTRPTTFDADSLMLVVAMAGIKSEVDAFVIGSLSYLGSRRRALQHPTSFLLIDEMNLIAKLEPIALRIGESFANGRKSGIRVGLAGQGIGDILACAAGGDIANSLGIKLTGKLQIQALSQYEGSLGYPYEFIRENASPRYGINTTEGYSRWLYDHEGLIPVRHYPSEALLRLVGNSRLEAQIREEFWSSWQGDLVSGLHRFVVDYPSLIAPHR